MTENPKTCQKCGSPVAPGVKFCESCGARIETLPSCPKCGAALVPGVKFCESCGAPTSPAAPVVTPVAETAAPPAPPVPETPPVIEAKPAAETVVKRDEPVKTEEKAVPAPEEKPAPPAPPVKAEEKNAPAPAPVKEPPKTEKAKDVPKETGPKKPLSKTTMIIAGIIVLALLGAAVFFVVLPMLSGSGTPAQTQPVSPAGTGSSTPSATSGSNPAGTFSLTAGPTDVPPTNRALIIDVEKNAISHDIIVTFQGGAGQYGVGELLITLTRSDGTVETKSLSHLERGSSITLKGTEKTDRIEVTANFYNGETYKVVDKVFEYKKRVGSN
jgi:hypothetical protein